MINIILITSKFKDKTIQLAEERILSHFEKINQTRFTLIKHYTSYNNTSVLFKKYPIAYIDNHLLPANKIVMFLYKILFMPNDDDVEHFDYLMMFLDREYRFTYKRLFNGGNVSGNNAMGVKREINIVDSLKSFVEFYKNKREKDFIYFVISSFIWENKSNEINEVDIGIKVNDYLFKNELVDVFLYDYNKSLFDSALKQYEIKFNESEININSKNSNNNNTNTNIEEQQLQQNWKNNLFSIGLFTFITGAMYLLSVLSHRKK